METEGLVRQSTSKRAGTEEIQEITEHWAGSVLPRREAGAHKWSVGGVLVVAGSPAFAGAAALCCAGAGRSGAGIVSAALPRSVAPVVVGLVPEVTAVILPDGDSVSVAQRAADAIGERLERSASIVIGPGLGTDETASALLSVLFGFAGAKATIGFGTGSRSVSSATPQGALAASGKAVVVDADALNWLSGQSDWWTRVTPERLVLTPHAGEMARLLGVRSDEIATSPAPVARDAAAKWQQTVVLKGGKTIVASPDGSVVGVDAPPSLATAGSGDVLSGSIGAFLAQGLSPRDAAALAVFVGSRAANRVAQRFGTLGIVASDLPQAIAEELCALETRGA